MKVLLIEPFYTGSHKYWADKIKQLSSHSIELLTLPGRHWKWRMQGAAIEITRQIKELKFTKPDTILISSIINLCQFKAFLPIGWQEIPLILYFHENQFAYPWKNQKRDKIFYCHINYTSALAASKIIFNSKYNRDTFIEGVKGHLESLPDCVDLKTIDELKLKAEVIPLGIDKPITITKTPNPIPILLWNHRWEHDKNPNDFFNALTELKKQNISFKLIVLGESYKKVPERFKRAKIEFQDEIIHWGYAKDKNDYFKLLAMADILPVTSNHEFFGLSVMEAVAYGAYPILPKRLSYPELFPFPECFYEDQEEFVAMIKNIHLELKPVEKFQSHIDLFLWKNVIIEYDQILR